jgi:UDP-N-acetylmuramoylalanine--D-glutamate ligase
MGASQAIRTNGEMGGSEMLLAPACASFDMYARFEARGDDFMQCVQELQDE